MSLYAILSVIHIFPAVVWLGLFPADWIIRKSIRGSKEKPEKKRLILTWFKVFNLCGMIVLTGILITGILLTEKFDYGFFQFASGGNLWLYTMQLLPVVPIIIASDFLLQMALVLINPPTVTRRFIY